jgi:anaerobic magnesium-protoporphyrin IX monomethyl ester cyclase
MKISLVSTYTRPVALGLRYVSFRSKAAGHDVEVFFMSSKRDTSRPDHGTDLLEDFTRRLRGCDPIGMSLMTNSFRRALTLTEQARMAGIEAPVLWGGVHPTLSPDECLVHADPEHK